MLMPVVLSLLFSIIFINFNSLTKNVSFTPPLKPDKIVQALKIIKTKFYQLPRLDQPLGPVPRWSVKKQNQEIDFEFSAQTGVILDGQDDSLFFAKRPDRPWPIASITKLFTAYVFLDYNPGWEKVYEIKAQDKRAGGKIYLFRGDRVTVKDLFYFSLVGSDNSATAALVRATGFSEEEFVKKANQKIKALGLKNTRIADTVGLQEGNFSTAREVALFAKIAFAQAEISGASLTKFYEFYTKQGRKKTIASTNELLSEFPAKGISLQGGKTGYLENSGYCLVSQYKDAQNKTIVVVVLGAPTDGERFSLTKKLTDFYYQAKP